MTYDIKALNIGTGHQFNELTKGLQFVKLTNESDI